MCVGMQTRILENVIMTKAIKTFNREIANSAAKAAGFASYSTLRKAHKAMPENLEILGKLGSARAQAWSGIVAEPVAPVVAEPVAPVVAEPVRLTAAGKVDRRTRAGKRMGTAAIAAVPVVREQATPAAETITRAEMESLMGLLAKLGMKVA